MHQNEQDPARQAILTELLAAQARGQVSAADLLEQCLTRIRDHDPGHASGHSNGQVYNAVFAKTARAEARAADTLRVAGVPTAPLAGLPIAVKVMLDVTGQITHAGSALLKDAPAAVTDAAVVQRLRQAGAVLTGHTGMTEFAYSGLGINPHFGTPANPFDSARIPGGSSAGSAVAVAKRMAAAAIGTDTGGSVRIPAAFCGLVGLKTSQSRVPMRGILPLAPSLDSVGPLAPTVACCALLDAVLAGEPATPLRPIAAADLCFAVPQRYVLDDMDQTVARAFERALQCLSRAGVRLKEISGDQLLRLPELHAGGGFTAAESFHWHRDLLSRHADAYDPRVRVRIERGAGISAADYLALQYNRKRQIQDADQLLQDVDALLMPTVAVVPPRFRDLAHDEAYARTNLLVLRNATVANMLDLCAITLPCHAATELPVGLMLVARNGSDRTLLRHAAAVEHLLAALA